MRLHRFYVKHPLGEEVNVEEKELVHQWSSVFRYTVGDSVLLFSLASSTFDYEYRITALSKSSATLSFVKKSANTMPQKKATLFMSLVKKDTFETVVRQATELMITNIVPLVAARSEKKNLNFERLLAIIIEAAEQCGRGDVPQLHGVLSFKDAAGLASSSHVIFDKNGENSAVQGVEAVWVGPEGGWTPDEILSLKEKGVKAVTLGGSMLKADTAAIVGMSRVFLG